MRNLISIITAIFTMLFAWLVLYLRVPTLLLALLSVGLCVFVAYYSNHEHSEVLSLDVIAQTSRLKYVSPTLKVWTLIALLIICVASKTPLTGLFLIFAIFIIAKFPGCLYLHSFLRILSLPLKFLLIGGFALLFELSPAPVGFLNISIFGTWLCVTQQTQIQTALTVSRALGAVSCLCLLSATTPLPDIISVLRRARFPDVIIDLMYLIYRYIFILTSLHHEMHNAAKSRLGFMNYRSGMRATGMIYSSLLGRSMQLAGKNFDAMESRCYDTGINFLENQYRAAPAQICVSAALIIVSLCLSLLPL